MSRLNHKLVQLFFVTVLVNSSFEMLSNDFPSDNNAQTNQNYEKSESVADKDNNSSTIDSESNINVNKKEKKRMGKKKSRNLMKEVEKHFSYSNVDLMLEEPLKIKKTDMNLIAPNENDFTDIEGLESFESLDLHFEDFNLSKDQEEFHQDLNKRYKRYLKTKSNKRKGNNAEGAASFQRGDIKKHFYNKDDSKTDTPSEEISVKESSENRRAKVERQLRQRHLKRIKKIDNLSDLDAFMNNSENLTENDEKKMKEEIEVMIKKEKIPNIDNMLDSISKARHRPLHRKKAKEYMDDDLFDLDYSHAPTMKRKKHASKVRKNVKRNTKEAKLEDHNDSVSHNTENSTDSQVIDNDNL